MSSKDPSEQIWTLMSEIGSAMVVTHCGDGATIRARPMAARPEIDDNAIYFLTDADAPKDYEIADNSNVCLAFADPKNNRYVSVTGTAEVFTNAALAERVWKPFDRAFWNDADDPRIRVIRVTPEQGEYWEGSGLIAGVVSMLTAGVRQERPKLADSEKVSMGA
jgi:general stress protein 26